MFNNMERVGKSYTKDVNAKNTKTSSNTLLATIQKEYELKRNSFYPSSISPNLFMGKLELRLKIYYRNLYKNTKEAMK